MAPEGSAQIGAMLDILKVQEEKASGKSLDLSKAFISSLLYISSWGGLYQFQIYSRYHRRFSHNPTYSASPLFYVAGC